MINVYQLVSEDLFCGDWLRYPRDPGKVRPIVVWNSTGICNLNCLHCYADDGREEGRELDQEEGFDLIRELASFGIPVLLFSGGEPLLKEGLFELNAFANAKRMNTVLSTNGTLIDEKMALKIRGAGFDYVGISIDGTESSHDGFRRSEGAYKKALNGIRLLQQLKQKTGLRVTLSRRIISELSSVFELCERENIGRVCFYHLVYSGRARALREEALSHEEPREALNRIFDWVLSLIQRGIKKEVLTVDNHADGIYFLLRLLCKREKIPEKGIALLGSNGGNRSGIGIASIDRFGNVFPDQFWRERSLGNIREKSFSRIWKDSENPFLRQLRNRRPLLKGRCGRCRWVSLCNGNFRARAEAVSGDPWAEDPACYLTDKEILGESVCK